MDEDDRQRLVAALAEVEQQARELPWAKERPWRAAEQVRYVESVPTVDLHGLSVRLGELAASSVLDEVPRLDARAAMFITGRGRHTGGISPLKETVNRLAVATAREKGWAASPRGPGRMLVVADAKRAPSAASGRLPIGFWLVVALVLAGLAFAFFG